jgi:hypothetical protein
LLTAFKAACGKSMENIRNILSKFCPEIGPSPALYTSVDLDWMNKRTRAEQGRRKTAGAVQVRQALVRMKAF